MSNVRTPLGDLMRRGRAAKGLNLRDLAGLVGTSHAYISQVERGAKRSISDDFAKALVRHLPISEAELQVAREDTQDHTSSVHDKSPPVRELRRALMRVIQNDDTESARRVLALLEQLDS